MGDVAVPDNKNVIRSRIGEIFSVYYCGNALVWEPPIVLRFPVQNERRWAYDDSGVRRGDVVGLLKRSYRLNCLAESHFVSDE